MTPKDWAGLAIAALLVFAVVYILFIREDQFTRYARRCQCLEGFTPNPHDGDCAVCRGYEPLTPSTSAKDAALAVPAGLRMGPECDFGCQSKEYSDANPFVQVRQRRPSDQTDMCCVMWGHADCAGAPVGSLPSISESGGVATPDQWEEWIESKEARDMGFVFIT